MDSLSFGHSEACKDNFCRRSWQVKHITKQLIWSAILPQSIGMTLEVFIIGTFILCTKTISKISFKNTLCGVILGIGNLALLISQLKLGLATAYPIISQASVIVAMFGGVLINKERKSGKGWVMTSIRILIVLAALLMIYLAGGK